MQTPKALACKILAGWAGPHNLNFRDLRESDVESGLGSIAMEHWLSMGLSQAGW